MATQVRINPQGEVLITFDDGQGVVFDQPLNGDTDPFEDDEFVDDEPLEAEVGEFIEVEEAPEQE